MAYAAVAEIDRLSEHMKLPARVAERVRSEFAGPLAELEVASEPGSAAASASHSVMAAEQRRKLRQAAIHAARRRLVKLHRARDIADETVHGLMRELDFDELRVSRSNEVD